jgi:hypothetical protein
MTTLLELRKNKFKLELAKLDEYYIINYKKILTSPIGKLLQKIQLNTLKENYTKKQIQLMNYNNYKINEITKQNQSTHTIGFIILRHVMNEVVNQYWIKSYNAIRKYYPENHILIIDDNSDYNFITEEPLYNTTIIKSDYPKRGELLPYYYFLHNKLFDIAVIIHDSVFINDYIDFSVDNYRFIWEFEHDFDNVKEESRIIAMLDNPELTNFYNNKELWKGCFGGMSIISHDYLTHINNKYDISKLLDYILCREDRKSFERIIACMLQKEGTQKTLLGNIQKYCEWELSINNIHKYQHLPIIKVWTGR